MDEDSGCVVTFQYVAPEPTKKHGENSFNETNDTNKDVSNNTSKPLKATTVFKSPNSSSNQNDPNSQSDEEDVLLIETQLNKVPSELTLTEENPILMSAEPVPTKTFADAAVSIRTTLPLPSRNTYCTRGSQSCRATDFNPRQILSEIVESPNKSNKTLPVQSETASIARRNQNSGATNFEPKHVFFKDEVYSSISPKATTRTDLKNTSRLPSRSSFETLTTDSTCNCAPSSSTPMVEPKRASELNLSSPKMRSRQPRKKRETACRAAARILQLNMYRSENKAGDEDPSKDTATLAEKLLGRNGKIQPSSSKKKPTFSKNPISPSSHSLLSVASDVKLFSMVRNVC